MEFFFYLITGGGLATHLVGLQSLEILEDRVPGFVSS